METRKPYQRVRNFIIDRMHRGEWGIGDKIPSETSLANELSVHRLTVNRVMTDLVREGRLERQRGVGTLVRIPAQQSPQPGLGRGVVGLVTSHGFDAATNPFFGAIFDRLRRDLQREGILLVPLGEADALVVSLREKANPFPVALSALVVLGPVPPSTLREIDTLGYQSVVVGYTEYMGHHVSVSSNDEEDAARVARKMIGEFGHHRIVHINARPPMRLVSRLEGFLRGCEEEGHALPFRYVVEADGLEVRDGRNAMMEFLRRDLPFTAVFGGCDHLAIGALGALRECGRKVPEEVSVVGFDGIDEGAHHHLPLATMAVARSRIASRAASAVLELLREPSKTGPAGDHMLLDSEWVQGRTLSHAPAKAEAPQSPPARKRPKRAMQRA